MMDGPSRSTLPTFIVIGAAKSGTSSLVTYLKTHPDVFMTNPKEPRFFGGINSERELEWYEALFDAGTGARARGEASTDYTNAPRWTGVPERMHRVVPWVKLVYLVREPVERIRSHYAYATAMGFETRPLAEAVTERSDYLNCSRYALQLEPYLELFPREHLLVISTDDLRDRRTETVDRVLEFIDVDPARRSGDLDHEVHRTVDLRRSRRWVPAARAVLRFVPIRRLPFQMRRRLHRATTTRAHPADTTFPPGFEDWLRDRLAGDQQRLRELLGSDADLWKRA